MGGERTLVITEITDDAYKQNSVYRPWVDIKLSGQGPRLSKVPGSPEAENSPPANSNTLPAQNVG